MTKEDLWAKAIERFNKKNSVKLDREHEIVLEYKALMQSMIGKQARALIEQRHGVSTASLYRWMRIYGKEEPWEATYRGIVSRCKGIPLYVQQGIKCRITPAELKEIWIRDGGDKMERPSIDRIDPAGDYVFHNCRYIELWENASRARRYKVVEAPRPYADTEMAKVCNRFGRAMGSMAKAAKFFDVTPNTFRCWAMGMKKPQMFNPAVIARIKSELIRIEKRNGLVKSR